MAGESRKAGWVYRTGLGGLGGGEVVRIGVYECIDV
jgi:hypothetical protein